MNAITQTAADLIRFRTTANNPQERKRCIAYIKSFFRDSCYTTEHFKHNGVESLVVSNRPKSTRSFDILLHGHIDVVDGPKTSFTPKIKQGVLYGRGATDMKGAVAALMHLMKQLPKDPSIALLITSDEEIGGENGTQHLIADVGYRGRFFLTAEGERDWLIKHKQKGVCMIRLEAKGIAEHSSYTWLGTNAIELILHAYDEIQAIFPHDTTDPFHWYSTINIGTITGGISTNAIPDQASATIDIRFCEPWKNANAVIKTVRSVLKKHPGVTATPIMMAAMMNTKTSDKYTKSLHSIAQKILKTDRTLYFQNHGTNDARFAAAAKIPAVGFGPVGYEYHAPNEHIPLKNLMLFYEMLKEFIETVS